MGKKCAVCGSTNIKKYKYDDGYVVKCNGCGHKKIRIMEGGKGKKYTEHKCRCGRVDRLAISLVDGEVVFHCEYCGTGEL